MGQPGLDDQTGLILESMWLGVLTLPAFLPILFEYPARILYNLVNIPSHPLIHSQELTLKWPNLLKQTPTRVNA